MPLPVFSVKNQQIDHLHTQVMALIDSLSCYRQGQEKSITQGAQESVLMRLSTRLYNIAYLLMLSRAEREGDIKPQDAAYQYAEMSRLVVEQETKPLATLPLPSDLWVLEQQSTILAKQVYHIAQVGRGTAAAHNIPHGQWQQIEDAFIQAKATKVG